jgi:hypothetical protein
LIVISGIDVSFYDFTLVMAGLVPAIHDFVSTASNKTWMPGTSPGMTIN